MVLAEPRGDQRLAGYAGFDQFRHLAIEEGQQQSTDVGAVHIGVGHDDDLVVARLGGVELGPDPAAEGRDDGLDFRARSSYNEME